MFLHRWELMEWIGIGVCQYFLATCITKFITRMMLPLPIIAQHGFEFKCSPGRTTTFDHDIELSDKHITGVLDPVLPSGVVTKAIC